MTSNATIALPNIESISTFDAVQISDKQTPFGESSASEKEENAQKNLPKSQAELEQEEEKARPLKRKTSTKLQYPNCKAKLEELLSQPQKRKKVLPFTYS